MDRWVKTLDHTVGARAKHSPTIKETLVLSRVAVRLGGLQACTEFWGLREPPTPCASLQHLMPPGETGLPQAKRGRWCHGGSAWMSAPLFSWDLGPKQWQQGVFPAKFIPSINPLTFSLWDAGTYRSIHLACGGVKLGLFTTHLRSHSHLWAI